MKDNSSTPVVERHGTFKESKFGIANNEDLVYIFDILRNKLYSDKIMAVVREYTTNAMDANVENGLPNEPIVIVAPSSMTPAFKVRDFGRGLSEDEIRSVYCMYGRSTKRNSNDFTGQLGLGSKSGFAYGDSFSITSFKDGVKSVYTAYIDESKLGAIAKISESPTTERSGIEITIPTKSSDVTQFQDRISRVARFFKVTPKINGPVAIQTFKINFGGSFWSLLSSDGVGHQYGAKNCFAVMGNIAYPIDPLMIFPSMRNSYSSNPSREYAILSSNTLIEFDIGELSIAASREELEYNSQTIEAIKKKSKKVAECLAIEIENRMNSCQDIIEAKKLSSQLSDSCGTYLWGGFARDVKWNGSAVNPFIEITSGYGVTIDGFRFYASKSQRTTSLNTIHVDSALDTKDSFWLNDDSVNCIKKMKQMAEKNPSKIFYLIRCGQSTTEDEKRNVSKEGYENLTRFMIPEKYLNKISTYELEKVESETVTKRIKKPKGSVVVYKLTDGPIRNFGNQSDNWVATAIDKSDIKVYVKLDRFHPIINGSEKYSDSIGKIKTILDHYGIKLPEVYGIKSRDVSAFGKDLVSIEDFCVTHLKNCDKFIRDCLSNKECSVASLDVWSDLDFFRYSYTRIDLTKNICGNDSAFTKFCEIIQEIKDKNNKPIIKQPEDLLYCGIKIPEEFFNQQGVGHRLKLAAKEVSDKYPLLAYMPTHLSAKENQDIFNKISQYAKKIDDCV